MKLPVIRGLIARRVLVNFRVKPEAAARLLPPPFRPKLVRGWAMAGVCLIRLERMRPSFLPAALGIASENAAHRIAVEWGDGLLREEGVFVPRRDTDSLPNRLAGGRIFPGVHHPAAFRVEDLGSRIDLDMRSRDGKVSVRLVGSTGGGWTKGSVFESLEEASAFFRAGVRGWSPNARGKGLDGIALCASKWRVEPLAVERVESSFFADPKLFPPGSAEPDCALLLRGIPHEWRAIGPFPPVRERKGGHRASRCAFFDEP